MSAHNPPQTPHTLTTNPSLQRIRLHLTTSHLPIHDLGSLSQLPNEIITQIILHTDLLTISRLRRTNRHLLDLVNTTPPFTFLLTTHPTILRAPYATRSAQHHTLSCLASALSPPHQCRHPLRDPTPSPPATINDPSPPCPNPPSYLYLPLLLPLCPPCLQSPSYLPIGPITAARNFGLPARIVDALPHLFTVPGPYGPQGTFEGQVRRLVDVGAARDAAVAYHGSLARMQRFVNHDRDLRWGFEVGRGGEEEGRRWVGVCELREG
ncbi:hypothetical protein BDZ85DRAFT_316229 [Elsinoe ampelina]|uniref:F-box domain-containing protein n=1 Tax=Elsinoe ampelina TaxID=302913 RepID=A0A6A6GLW9_9PEZI|nr:hypothetical protein BDZ85DRAFT_316229 [Elsinoe ampelina]